MKKSINSKPIEGTPCELNGVTDISATLIAVAILLLILLLVISALLVILKGWEPKVIAITGCFLFGPFAIIEGVVALCCYLIYRHSYIRLDKTGIAGKGKMLGKKGFKLVEFAYSWREIKKIDFAYENMENLIVLTTTKDETFAYSYTYRFVRHTEVLDAIKTFGNVNLLDEANIKEVEESYSPRRIILNCIGIGIIIALAAIFKLYVRGKLF